MKKTKLLGLAFIATMTSFTACTNDAELVQESEIKLTSEITPSRVADSELQSTQIVAGREVGVTITGAKNDEAETKNMLWTVNDNGSLKNEGTPVYYGDGSATVTAYHPYNSTWTSTSHVFSVSTNQTEETDFLNSDLLWATASSAKKESAISLEFAHKLAKINVTLVPEKEGDDLNGATISICNTKISTTFNPATGHISDATGNTEEIIAGVTTANAYTASAIVIPQTVSGKFIKIAHEGKTYYYTLPSGKTLESGYSYSYRLTVKGNLLISTESNINPWDDKEEVNEGDAEEIDFSWFNPNQYISYVSNYEQLMTNDDASKPDIARYTSYISCPATSISKIEIKFQMANIDNWMKYYKSLHVWSYSRISLGTENLKVCGNTYSWDDLGTGITDLMVLSISYKDKYIKLNGANLEHNIASDVNSYMTGGYFLSSGYSEDYDDGWLREWKSGVSEGSKLYYVKFWDENDELIYLGAASTALNPTTNEVENCWRSYYNGIIGYQFAHNSETLSNYQPYGGGVDKN